MIRKSLTILATVAAITAGAQSNTQLRDLSAALGETLTALPADCDTIVDCRGYAVRAVMRGGQPERLGLDLFSDVMLSTPDGRMLDYISSVLLAEACNTEIDGFGKVSITGGTIADFKKVGPSTPVSVKSADARLMTVEWPVDSAGRTLRAEASISYQNAKGGTRSEIEDRFIASLKASDNGRRVAFAVNGEDLEPYFDSLYVLPGGYYLNKEITRNVYLRDDSVYAPVWDERFPLESMADLMLYPADSVYGDIPLELTVLKHEYGEKETMTINLDRFLAAAEKDGCMPFWGIERFDNGHLEASLFLFNSRQGYDHVVKIECDPTDVIRGDGLIKARASLYIPTNNVDTLFRPYKKKTEKEKIKWRK